MNDNYQPKLMLSLGRRLMLLLCFFITCYVLLSFLAVLFIKFFGATSTPGMRILTVIQDILLFIVPAVGTAVMITRRPDMLLCIGKKPEILPTLAAIATLLVSVPAMNWVIALNEGINLPPDIAQSLRTMEESASGMIQTVVGPHTIPNLIMTILIIGVLAGLSEELLFRGCLQRLLSTGGLSAHAAIWIAAVLFSLLHMQFYGFIPRMLLGAFFGYLLYWTGSLWVPVILHISNNTMYLIEQYRIYGETESPGSDSNLVVVIFSMLFTAMGLYYIYYLTHQKNEQSSITS